MLDYQNFNERKRVYQVEPSLKKQRTDDTKEDESSRCNLPCAVNNNEFDLEIPLSETGTYDNELVVKNLLITSKVFLKRAHAFVLNANSHEGTKRYFKMIKISIKALLILIKKYGQCLNPMLELVVYFKLAKIYFSETDNLNKADDYVNKAIVISTRNNLIKVKCISELLAAQILEKTNTKILLKYVDEKMISYKNVGLNHLSNLFKILKVNNLIYSDYTTALVVLQSLSNDPDIDKVNRILCLLFQSNIHLYRGSPIQALKLLEEVENLISLKDVPSQIYAMLLLLKYSTLIHNNNPGETKKMMHEINAFITNEQKNDWMSWREDGFFKLSLSVSLAGDNDISYQVSWLNSDEFVILFYFITGVALLNETYGGKSKAKKVFEKCLEVIEKQLKELTRVTQGSRDFPLNQLNNKILKLNFIKYQVMYYQVWANFIKGDLGDLTPLNEFMTYYNEGKFTNEELCYYKLLLPKLFYIFAIYYQNKGDINAAKNYFMKTRNYSSSLKKTRDKNVPILQLALGVGSECVRAENNFSELYVFSTLHLLILSEYELSTLSKCMSPTLDINNCHKFCTILYQDLSKVFNNSHEAASNSFSMSFVSSNLLLEFTYKLLLFLYDSKFSKGEIKQLEGSSFPFLEYLQQYLIYKASGDLGERNEYFQKCIANTAEGAGSELENALNIIVLQDHATRLQEMGQEEERRITETKIKSIEVTRSKKVKLLASANTI
ncbi:uncharacterized protein PRCAT00000827001 [Priceomyces carsonii]|uniref:uncharacterized protein n=1 Tax=Priceomyces carsonii TaxID=28549 RepID=UPI002EDA0ACF|nr:unnamed protein product [Priceomyces carsonii]